MVKKDMIVAKIRKTQFFCKWKKQNVDSWGWSSRSGDLGHKTL